MHLGGEDDILSPKAGQGLADDLLGLAGGVHVGRVDEVDTRFEGPLDDAHALVVVGRPPRPEHHGSEAEGRDPHAGAAEGAKFHEVGWYQPW